MCAANSDNGNQGQKTERKQKFGDSVWWKHYIAGASAGVVSRTCTAPLDRLKIYSQIHGKTEVISTFKKMIQTGGFLSLWRGNFTNLCKVAPEVGMRFLFYYKIKEYLKSLNKGKKITTGQQFLAGMSAAAVSQTIVYPLDVHDKFYKQEGLKFFSKGYFSHIVGIVLYAGLNLSLYEKLKMDWTSYKGESAAMYEIVSLGALSAMTCQYALFPINTIAVILQTSSSIQKGRQKRVSVVLSLLQERLRTKGLLLGLYGGSVSALMKSVPTLAISYSTYEFVLKNLGAQM